MEFSDFKAFDLILKEIPSNIQLQISNSSSIRYLQLFDLKKHQVVFCNRGTSGIDGSTSTAIGAAVGAKKETLLITGDLSFFYDSNALWNNYIPSNFKIIIMNNSGGGIFRILPGHQENDVFNTFFETSHHLSAKYLAKMYDFDYFEATNEGSVVDGCEKLFKSEKPSILEIFTPEKLNDAVLKSYFSFLNNI
jgi:2-succinyl-5-enolpyruvyl-6-hydroxy-3-cyclohexene-1-carboxylate synthase